MLEKQKFLQLWLISPVEELPLHPCSPPPGRRDDICRCRLCPTIFPHPSLWDCFPIWAFGVKQTQKYFFVVYILVHAWELALWDPTDCSPPCPWDSPGKNTGVGCNALLQGSSWPRDQTQGSNSHLLHCMQILYHWATKEAQHILVPALIMGQWSLCSCSVF